MTCEHRVIDSSSPEYPITLRAMARPPDKIYVRGELPVRPAVAIVGTRDATDQAVSFTTRLARYLVESGISVWSGGAEGVDAAAHRGALDAGGSTVVVMGTGFDQVFPAHHADLFERIIDQGGGWLSHYPPGHCGGRWTFLSRNELLASMVLGVIVVQAPLKSGARSTAAAARRMGRPLWVVPQAPWDRVGAGCVLELGLGASALTDVTAVLDTCGISTRASRFRMYEPASLAERAGAAPELPGDLTVQELAVARAVITRPGHVDDICKSTGIAANLVASALLTLTLRNILLEAADGCVHPVRSKDSG